MTAGSALYLGRVTHRRLRPKPHRLSYRVWHLLLDLDELDQLDRRVRGFGHDRRAAVAFLGRDHFGPSPAPVRDKLANVLAERGVDMPDGRVTVLTYPRVLGFVFNPVSFWFLHERSGELAVVVAEVNNTFGDDHCYVLDELEALPGGRVRASAAKVLHVSPFLPIDGLHYTFTISPPRGDRDLAAVHMDVHDPDGKVLEASLVGQRRPLTSGQLARALLARPLVTLHTVVGIHLQALRITLGRKAAFHRRPPGGRSPNHRPHGVEPTSTTIAARSATR